VPGHLNCDFGFWFLMKPMLWFECRGIYVASDLV
jgi:hypothetical protein